MRYIENNVSVSRRIFELRGNRELDHDIRGFVDSGIKEFDFEIGNANRSHLTEGIALNNSQCFAVHSEQELRTVLKNGSIW